MDTSRHTAPLPLTRERLLALFDDVLACPDVECLDDLRLAIAGARAPDVHARMGRDLIALRERELRTRSAAREAAKAAKA